MATSSIASFTVALAPAANVRNTTAVARSSVAFPRKSCFMVRAAGEATESAPAAPAEKKPPPIGPKKGTKVKILRRESYWFNGYGSVVTVDQDPSARYPVMVRFNKINYQGVATSSYALDEIVEV